MPITTPMKPVAKVGKFQLFLARGRQFANEGLHLWTGRRHVQIWPLSRFGKGSD